jgi:ABC-type Mn2+/Zn2+ transport system permease subunit
MVVGVIVIATVLVLPALVAAAICRSNAEIPHP